MSNFKIEIQGLAELKASLSSNVTKRALPDVSIAVLKFNNILDNRVHAVFNVKDSIETIRVGKSVKPVSVGKSLLIHSLQYRDKPVPLSYYPFTITPNTTAISKAPLRTRSGIVKWTPGLWSKDVKVSVRKNKPTIAHRGKNYRLKGFALGNVILARKGKATWGTFPAQGVQGIRAPYSMLYGPSIATLVSTIYDKDPEVKRGRETMMDEIVDAIIKGYTV